MRRPPWIVRISMGTTLLCSRVHLRRYAYSRVQEYRLNISLILLDSL
jgi:hypothetical protein